MTRTRQRKSNNTSLVQALASKCKSLSGVNFSLYFENFYKEQLCLRDDSQKYGRQAVDVSDFLGCPSPAVSAGLAA